MANKLHYILSFDTPHKYNRLSTKQQLELLADLTQRFNGATLTEHLGGYTNEDGRAEIEYSYSIELLAYPATVMEATDYIETLAQENNQESYILNDRLYYNI